MTNNYTVSIIMPAFNGSKFIGDSIKSVINQSHRNWELIVVDDCSSDNTGAIVENYCFIDERIKLIRLESNVGISKARNSAIEIASGRFIAFLDCDDLWIKDKLEKQLSFMVINSIPFSFSAYNKVDVDGKFIYRVSAPAKLNYYDLLKTNSIGCLTAMYDSEFFGKVYMPIIEREDYATWLYILKRLDFARGLDDVLAYYRIHSESNTANKYKAAKKTWFLYRNHLKLPFFNCCYYFFNYAIRGLLRSRAPRVAKLFRLI